MINSMGKELNIGMIARNTKDHTIKEISMGLEAILGLMDLITLGIGLKIRYKETVSTPGKTAESTTEIGWTITWKVKEHTLGQTEENMSANTSKIKNMEKVCTHGPMVDAMTVNGKMEDNMEWVNTRHNLGK